jgi:hypothetical protein
MSIASIKAKIAELEADAANYEAYAAQETAITGQTSGTITINEETFLNGWRGVYRRTR